MKRQIIQIIAAQKPLYAAFRNDDTETDEFFLGECPVVALVEEEDGNRYVIGLTLAEYGYEDPEGTSNFAGYASSKEEAADRYGKRDQK